MAPNPATAAKAVRYAAVFWVDWSSAVVAALEAVDARRRAPVEVAARRTKVRAAVDTNMVGEGGGNPKLCAVTEKTPPLPRTRGRRSRGPLKKGTLKEFGRLFRSFENVRLVSARKQ